MKNQTKTFSVLLLTCFYACTNPFSTRIPEEPLGQTTTTANLQTSPDSILKKISLNFHSKNSVDYKNCFIDTFLFIPEQTEESRIINWTLGDEEIYFNNFVNSFEQIDFQYTVINIQETPGKHEVIFTYNISAILKPPDSNERYLGQSILELQEIDGLWYIFKWEDLKLNSAANDSTWSTLKANYRIN